MQKEVRRSIENSKDEPHISQIYENESCEKSKTHVNANLSEGKLAYRLTVEQVANNFDVDVAKGLEDSRAKANLDKYGRITFG